MLRRASRAVAATLLAALAMSACTGVEVQPDVSGPAVSEPPARTEPAAAAEVRTVDPDAPLTVVADADERSASLATSRALFEASPTVLVAPAGDASAQELAGRASIALGVPLLLAEPAPSAAPELPMTPEPTPSPGAPSPGAQSPSPAASPGGDADAALLAELQRLSTSTALVVGAVAPHALEGAAGVDVQPVRAAESAVADAAEVDIGRPVAESPDGFAAGLATAERSAGQGAAPLTGTVALAVDGVEQLASIATARAAGLAVHLVPHDAPNPQAHASVIEALHASAASRTLALGAAFATLPALDWQVRSARSGFQLPGGGQLPFDDRMVVALYGTPSTAALGVLGEQDAAGAVQRAREVAAPYEALTDETVVPAFEMIATVASGGPGADGDYSNELDPERLRPWVEAAADAGIAVVLDLQPGRTDFLTQARRYESLLSLPNVGLALDPEWRLAPDEVHLQQIGSVTAAEVNEVVTWLADLTNELGLPPKLLVLHQFRPDMITDRGTLDLSRPELAVLLHVDGLGTPSQKQATWARLQRDAPPGLHWGWKNFIDEDRPMLTPEQTMREVSPTPDLVTYQ